MSRGKASDAAAAEKVWSWKVGYRPLTVSVRERRDRNCRAELRWARRGTGRFDRLLLPLVLRDERGVLVRAAMEQAREAARRAHLALVAGIDPRRPTTVVETRATEALTIEEGLARTLAVPSGMYGVENEHVREMRRFRDHILKHLPQQYRTWESLTAHAYCELWRALAHWRRETCAGRPLGRRSAELTVILLAQAGRWLKRAGLLQERPESPAPNWKADLANDWLRITQASGERDPSNLRYSEEELGRILLALDSPSGDPRIRLMLRVGAEARLGQVRRCARSNLTLTTQEECNAGVFGELKVPGRAKKLGVVIELSCEMRAHLEEELREGYLRDLERAFQAGEVTDYMLFPSGRLRYDLPPSKRPMKDGEPIGVVCTRRALSGATCLDDRSVHDLYRAFEDLAGVKHVPGRGWYGIRRRAADMAEDVEADGRALNAITGHASDETRRRIYQEKQRKAVQRKAGRAREAARAAARRAAGQAREP